MSKRRTHKKEWFSPADLKAMDLPGLPTTKRGINSLASREKWATLLQPNGEPACRKATGRGAGKEYYYTVFPDVTIQRLFKMGLLEIPEAPLIAKPPNWQLYDRLPRAKKTIAEFRLNVLVEVREKRLAGFPQTEAVHQVVENYRRHYDQSHNKLHKFSRATLYNWLKMTKGLKREDWLPALAPKHVGRTKTAKISQEIIRYIKGDYLRPEKPSFQSCFDRLELAAAEHGWTLPHPRTLERRFLDGVSRPAQVFLRDGPEALERMFPAQKRDRNEFHALEAINADGHIWDVFVHDKDGKPYRPVMCAIQDLYSGKMLSWRIGKTLAADIVRLSFGDCFRDYGIPSLCWLDNGREFAAKMVTGGTETRYRFKVKEEEPVGFLTALGVDVRWTRPYRGQSKPIERAFRDFCDHIAKHPAFAGAYTGNHVMNKPANYGKKSIPIAKFKAIVAQGIAMHNAKEGRRTEACQARLSFDQAFTASYAASSIKRATEAQLRLCMLAGEVKKSDRKSGTVKVMGNTYWAEEMAQYPGDKFIVRFDPDALHAGVAVYLMDGSFLCDAPCWDSAGFSDQKAAREHANVKKRFMKAEKEKASLVDKYEVDQIAELLPDIDPEEMPELTVMRPVFEVTGNAAVELSPDVEIDNDAMNERMSNLIKFKSKTLEDPQ